MVQVDEQGNFLEFQSMDRTRADSPNHKTLLTFPKLVVFDILALN